ncbi:MAG: hypothetical protein QOF21_8 [Actinomycetota bacterium]|jgi:hypothetical protein
MAADDHSSTDSSANTKLTWETPRVNALDEPTIADGPLLDIVEVFLVSNLPSN